MKSNNNIIRSVAFFLAKDISLWKTIYFNFHYFSFSVAVKFPVILHKSVRLERTRGHIVIDSFPIRTGMIRIGKKTYGFTRRHDHTIWEQKDGTVILESGVCFGKGTFIYVGENAVLRIGQNTCFGGNDKIICNKSITVNANTKVAWDVQIIDTDFRPTINTITKSKNCFEKEIIIGNHNWLCFGSTILRGSITPNNCIVRANTLINKDFSEEGENIIIGSDSNAKVLAKYITW